MGMTGKMSSFSRRHFLATLAGASVAAATPQLSLAAVSGAQAEKLIGEVVKKITQIIGSSGSSAAKINKFEKIFAQYADVRFIALSALGPDGRSASDSQKRAFVKAFQGYMARRYGGQFQKFSGGTVKVVRTTAQKKRFEVLTQTKLAGSAPFDVVFIVSARNGKFIDMRVEGISILKAERKEVGAMLDRRRGDLNKLIADLSAA